MIVSLKFFTFCFLTLFEVYLDDLKSDSITGLSLNFFHHIFACIVFFPFLHGFYKLHLCLVLLTIVNWSLCKNCILSEIVNNYCNTPGRKFQNYHYFITNAYPINVSTKNQMISLLTILILFSTYKIIHY